MSLQKGVRQIVFVHGAESLLQNLHPFPGLDILRQLFPQQYGLLGDGLFEFFVHDLAAGHVVDDVHQGGGWQVEAHAELQVVHLLLGDVSRQKDQTAVLKYLRLLLARRDRGDCKTREKH